MPLEGSGSVARPFCCRAGAWWPTLAQQGHLATYVLLAQESWRVFGPAASKGPQNGPKSWLLFFCDAIGGVWKCCSSFLLSGRRMVANPSPQQGHLATYVLRRAGGVFGPAASEAAAKWPEVMAPLLL